MEQIINRLKELGIEISKQDVRSTAKPLYCSQSRENFSTSNCFSFFETDVINYEDNYILANVEADKMNELRELLIELSKLSL